MEILYFNSVTVKHCNNEYMLPFKKDKKQAPEIYFAIEINEEIIKSSIWKIVEEGIEVLKVSQAISIENSKKESALDAVDMALATISDDLETEPNKVIFGLPEDWVEANGIIEKKRDLLKFLCQKLEFKPLGFVVIQDALVTYLKSIQGTPPNTIFVRFCEEKLIITLVKLGKIEGQEKVNRSDDPVSDIKEGLARFDKKTQLPAQITLYNSHTDFEDIRQQLLGASLEKDLPFLHTPKIDFLDPEISIKAVTIAGGTEVAKTLVPKKELIIEQKVEKPNIITSDTTTVLSETSGLPEGFELGEESEVVEDIIETSEETLNQTEEIKTDVSPTLELETESVLKPKAPKPNFFKNFTNIFSKLKFKFPKKLINLPSKSSKKTKIIIIIVAILILISASLVFANQYFYQNSKAAITIFVNPQNIQKEVDVKVSLETENLDLDNFITPAKYEEITVEGNLTQEVTGTKKIGEKAKGKVTIYNKTNKVKTFKKDEILVGPENLRFILASDIEVASKSAQETDGGESVTYGSAEADVIAGDIGENYNLTNESEFTFKDYSDDNYTAKSKGAIAGGTSQEIQTLTKEDEENAQDALEKKLILEAREKLEKEQKDNLIIFKDISSSDLGETSMDKEIGDETSSFQISGNLTLKILTSSKKDFTTILQKVLESVIPNNYVVSSEGLSHKVISFAKDEKTKKGEEIYNFKISASANLMPKFDFANIKQNIIGKKPGEAEKYLQTLSNYAKTQMTISPVLPENYASLPKKPENITIEIKPNQ